MHHSTVFYFNPTCELAIANGSFSYMPPLLLQEMEQDLAILPFIFGTPADYVVAQNPPGTGFIQLILNSGFNLPVFADILTLEAMPKGSFSELSPWGWSPSAHFILRNLKNNCSEEFRKSPVFDWKAEHKQLFERESSLNFLNKLLAKNRPDRFISPALTGVRVTSFGEIELLLGKHEALVLKAPLSSSGRGIQMIRKKELNTSNKQWISGVLKHQYYLIAEPFLDKVLDISFQFQLTTDGTVYFSGYSLFETNSNGQYRGTLINPQLDVILPAEKMEEIEKMITLTAEILADGLRNSAYTTHYRGFIGIDALIFRDQERLMMQPCIEINCRTNMGILAKHLEHQIHPDARGKFELYYGKAGEYMRLAEKQMQINPPVYHQGKLLSGFLPLVEPDHQKKFGAYISLDVAR